MNPGDTLGIGELKAFASRRQQVPAQGTVADAALQNQDRRLDSVAYVVADAKLRAYLSALDGHPLVVEAPHATGATTHDAHVADVFSFSPITGHIYEVGVQVLFLNRVFE